MNYSQDKLLRWSQRMPNDALVKAEQAYLQAQLPSSGQLLLLGNHKSPAWLPAHHLTVYQLAPSQPTGFTTDTWISADLDALPLRDNAINIIILPYLLDYYADPVSVLKELFRILLPEGKLCVLGLHRWHPWSWSNAPKAPHVRSLWRVKRLGEQAKFIVGKTQVLHYGALYGLEFCKRVKPLTPRKLTWPPLWQNAPAI